MLTLASPSICWHGMERSQEPASAQSSAVIPAAMVAT